MLNIYYQSSNGADRLYLNKSPYHLQKGTDLLNHSYSYAANDYETRIDYFDMAYVEKSNIAIRVESKDKEQYKKALNDLYNITERDLRNKKPGRLYVGNQYLTCFVIGAEYESFDVWKKSMIKTLTVVSEDGQWIEEVPYSFSAAGSDVISQDYLDFDYDMPYDYSSANISNKIINSDIVDSDFKLTVYGHADDPLITIGENVYNVDVKLATGEYMIIDSKTKTVVMYKENGEAVNLFNRRNREHYIFTKIAPGSLLMLRNGVFSVDVVLYQKRSEPSWWRWI